jgi:hypothetical protein
MTLRDVLRISKLMHRFGLTPAQAAALAGLCYGHPDE